MQQENIQLAKKQAQGCVVPLGPLNLVFAYTDKGLLGCGAFDVMALDKFNYPAARVKSSKGASISSVQDLLEGLVKDANESASKLGITVGMTGKEALEKM